MVFFSGYNLVYAIAWGMLVGIWGVVLSVTLIYFIMKYDQWNDEKQVIEMCYNYAKRQRRVDYDKLMAVSQEMQNANKKKLLENARVELRARKADRIRKESEESCLAEHAYKKNYKKKKNLSKAVGKVPIEILVNCQSSEETDRKKKKKKKKKGEAADRHRSTDTFEATQNSVSQITDNPSVSQISENPTISQTPSIASNQTLFQPKKAVDSRMSMTSETTNNTTTGDLR